MAIANRTYYRQPPAFMIQQQRTDVARERRGWIQRLHEPEQPKRGMPAFVKQEKR